MPLFRKAICAVFFILLLVQMPVAASFTAVAAPELFGASVLVADLHGDGQEKLLLGKEGGVFVLDEGGLQQFIEVPGRVTAVAVGDVTGDFRHDLAVGTDRGGALYLYTERAGTWERHGHAQYLWDTIIQLGIHDFNGDGWGDVVALTDKGEAYVYLSREGNLFPLWKSPAGELVVGCAVLDVDRNGYPDLIFTLRTGYVAVLTWGEEEFVPLWENYPWGAVESLAVVSDASSPEWLVVTSQKMLYAWRWQNGEVINSRKFEAQSLGERLVYIPKHGLLSLSSVTGISLFELQSSEVVEKWRVPGLFGDDAFFYAGDFYFRDPSGAYLRLVEGAESWRVFVHDQEVTGYVDVLRRDGQLYVNLLNLAPILGLTARLEGGWKVSAGPMEVTLWPERTVLDWQGFLIPLGSPLVEEGGLPFLPMEVLPLLGWTVQIDALRQLVVFVENWGWWI